MKYFKLITFLMLGLLISCSSELEKDDKTEVVETEVVIEDYEPITQVKSLLVDLTDNDFELAKKKVTDAFYQRDSSFFSREDGFGALDSVVFYNSETIFRTKNKTEVYLRFLGLFDNNEEFIFNLIIRLNRIDERWLIDAINSAETKKILYNESGKVVTEKEKAVSIRLITYNTGGKILGIVREYYMPGETFGLYSFDSIGNIHKYHKMYDKPNGNCVLYHINGNKARSYTMIDGSLDGTNTIWDEQGRLVEETNYTQGIIDGLSIEYYETGKVRLVKVFESGYESPNVLRCNEQGNCQFVFEENFLSDENENGWSFIEKTNDFKNSILPGKGLLMDTYSNKTNLSLVSLPTDYQNNFSIETMVDFKRGNKKTEQGLIWAYKNQDNYNYFLIKPNGRYKIGFVIEGTNNVLDDWTKSKVINKKEAENTLKIFKVENKILYAINREIVSTQEVSPTTGDQVGFYTSGKESVLFHNLIVKQDFKIAENTAANLHNNNTNEWKGNGSGFLIDKRGYIATNYHVVKDAHQIEVSLNNTQTTLNYNAIVVATDEAIDLAILKIDDLNFYSLSKIQYNFSTHTIDVGSDIFTMGYPMALSVLGDEVKFTSGKISSQTGFRGNNTIYQISVPVQPGNSGGPLFDYDGNLIGIVNAKIMEADNVSYAIKSQYLYNLLLDISPKINTPADTVLRSMPLTEKIKVLTGYVVMIKIK